MGKTILTVDDAATMRKMIAFTLKGAGHEVLEAGDGVEALTLLKTRSADLVITDVNMPNMDGITFVTEAKKLPAYKFTPVIMLTTESGEEKKKAGQAAGAKAWVVKPFQPPQMLAAVAKLVLS